MRRFNQRRRRHRQRQRLPPELPNPACRFFPSTVNRTADGKVTAVNVVTGSFLGFGSKLVSIPDGRFAYDGKIVRIEMTADDVSALPHQGP